MGAVFATANVALLRLVRDRTNVFFLLLFPLLLVLLIGATFGGAQERVVSVATVDDPLAEAVVEDLAATDGLTIRLEVDAATARSQVRSGRAAGALLLERGSTGVVATWLAQTGDTTSATLRGLADGVVARQDARFRAGRVLVEQGLADDLPTAVDAVASNSSVDVSRTSVGEDELAEEFAGLGQFDLGATSQLLLFVFVTSLASSATLIQLRTSGVVGRALAAPIRPVQLVGGLLLGQLGIALFQAVTIVVGTALLFGVDWGDPLASGAVVVLFSAVAAGAGLLLGAALHNDEQAGGLGVPLGLGLAALGGCMVPLELLPEGLRTVSRLTPHAWGYLAFADIVRRGAGVTDVLPQLGVLAGFAVVLCGLGSAALLRSVTR